MSQDASTATQEQLTPQERRDMLRAFADRMLRKLSTFDDPADLPALERATRSAAAIERIYSRCDRAEKHTPDPNKLEAERADNAAEAIRARLRFTQTYEWGEERRKALGRKWTKAQKHLKSQTPEPSTSFFHTAPLVGRGTIERSEEGGGGLPSDLAATKSELSYLSASRNPTTVCAPDGAGRPGTGRPASPTSQGGIESPHGASRCPDHQVMPEEDDDSASQTAQAPVANRQASTTDPGVTYVDYTDVINAARISLGLKPCTDYDDP